MKSTNIFICGICILIFGCNVLKKSSSEKTSEGNLQKSNISTQDTGKGGSSSSSLNSSKEQFDWTRTTFQFPKDTSTNITNVYPSTIIYEKGSGSKETEEKKFDSSWFFNALSKIESKVDSTNKMHSSELSSKKSTTDWKLYGLIIIVGLLLLDKITKFIPYKFKLEKK